MLILLVFIRSFSVERNLHDLVGLLRREHDQILTGRKSDSVGLFDIDILHDHIVISRVVLLIGEKIIMIHSHIRLTGISLRFHEDSHETPQASHHETALEARGGLGSSGSTGALLGRGCGCFGDLGSSRVSGYCENGERVLPGV
jgi:hypothetical protein